MENEDVVKRMNETLIGQHGIVMLTGYNRPKYVGTLKSAELKSSNILFTFSDNNVLFFAPLAMVNIVGEQKEDGSFPVKDICDALYIGDKLLMDIFKEIFGE